MKSFDRILDEEVRFGDSQKVCFGKGFEAGQQSKQAEVDELRFQRDVLSNKVDELQKQIDRAVEHIEDYYGVVELSMIVDILNGEQS